MSKRGKKKYQRTPNALTDFDMRKMWIFVCCFPHKGVAFLKKEKKKKREKRDGKVFPPLGIELLLIYIIK